MHRDGADYRVSLDTLLGLRLVVCRRRSSIQSLRRQSSRVDEGIDFEKIAHTLDVSPIQIVKSARRLGISLRPKLPKVDRRLKTKGKS
jgi:hypothetical protein